MLTEEYIADTLPKLQQLPINRWFNLIGRPDREQITLLIKHQININRLSYDMDYYETKFMRKDLKWSWRKLEAHREDITTKVVSNYVNGREVSHREVFKGNKLIAIESI